MPFVKVKKQRESDDDEAVMVEDAPPAPPPSNGRSRSNGRRQEQERQQPQQAEDDGEEGESILTAAERGLTLETWQDRPVDAQSASQQLKLLDDEYKPLLTMIQFTLEELQDTAVSLSEAGIKDDEGGYFAEIDLQFQKLVDEAEIVKLRKAALGEIRQTLDGTGEIYDIQGRFRTDCRRREEEYIKKTPRQRFSKSDIYIIFREAFWESQHGSDMAMPPVVDFFPRGEEDDDDSDDEIQLGGAVQTYKDPITLTTLVDPYTSTVCPHSFSHETIIQYLEGAAKQCPVAGCDSIISALSIKPDAALAKRIAADQRRKEREQAALGPEDDVEELDD